MQEVFFPLCSNAKVTREEVNRSSEVLKVKKTEVVTQGKKKNPVSQCGYPSVLRHKASGASPCVFSQLRHPVSVPSPLPHYHCLISDVWNEEH